MTIPVFACTQNVCTGTTKDSVTAVLQSVEEPFVKQSNTNGRHFIECYVAYNVRWMGLDVC